MLRLLFRPAFYLSVLMIFPIVLIRNYGLDDASLSAFFATTDSCPAPCFMGIRPGVTSLDELIQQLERHEWVDSFSFMAEQGEQGQVRTIAWRWSSAQPDWIDNDVEGRIIVYQQTVSSLSVSSHIELGELWSVLGRPDRDSMSLLPGAGSGQVYYTGTYRDLRLFASYQRLCPAPNFERGTLRLTWFGGWNWLGFVDDLPFHRLINAIARCPQS